MRTLSVINIEQRASQVYTLVLYSNGGVRMVGILHLTGYTLKKGEELTSKARFQSAGALTKTWKLDDDLVAYYYLDGRPLPCMRYGACIYRRVIIWDDL